MANIKQIIPCEPGWEGVFVREDATWDSPVKSASAPVVGWALIDDENGDSSVHALLSLGAGVTSSYDVGPRYLGAARGGDYSARLVDQWEAAAAAYMEEYGEPGAEGGEEGGEEGNEEGGEGEKAEGGDAPPAASGT